MPSWLSGRRRIIAAVATLAAFGGIVTVTQVSNAATNKATGGNSQQQALAACNNIATPPSGGTKVSTKRSPYTANGAKQFPDDNGTPVTAEELRAKCRTWVMQNVGKGGKGGGKGGNNGGGTATTAPTTGASAGNGNNGGGNNNGGGATTTPTDGASTPPNNGLDVLARDCSNSKLQTHTGFQIAPACVTTEFGEVSAAANNPSLLITKFPNVVKVNTPFTFTVSTRNLIRNRFLGAAAGGYYLESSVLKDGLEQGHFHSMCRILQSTTEAPDPSPVPAFFVATEDGKGGAAPDSVTISVPGLPSSGTFQCGSWAGDGSHRIPMMERANEMVAADTFRIRAVN